MTREEAIAALHLLRLRIDDADRRILQLISERADIVSEIGRIKQKADLPIYEPLRESQVFQNVCANNPGPLDEGAIRRVFERIIDEMRRVQRLRMETEGREESKSAPH